MEAPASWETVVVAAGLGGVRIEEGVMGREWWDGCEGNRLERWVVEVSVFMT
jgi:hypothetical protein